MATRDVRTRLVRRAARINLFLADDLAAALTGYYELLARWNRKINLTSLDDPDAAIDRLLLEPVIAARLLPTGPFRLMDIGSGGGSPAIPLRLACSKADLTMVEAKARKSAFLREAIRHLLLQGATVENSRYEELLAKPELHEAFDVLTVRAVRVEPRVLGTLQAFVKPGGTLMLFRGPTGPENPPLVPTFEWRGTYPLIESLQSRVTLVGKRMVGGSVPRGTLSV